MTLRHFVRESGERESGKKHKPITRWVSFLSHSSLTCSQPALALASTQVAQLLLLRSLSLSFANRQLLSLTLTLAQRSRNDAFISVCLFFSFFLCYFYKFSTNPQRSTTNAYFKYSFTIAHTALLRIIESLSIIVSYLLFLVCDADADAHYTALSTKVARQLKLKLFERLQRHSAEKENGSEREIGSERLGTDRAQCSLMVSASQLQAHIHTLAYLYVCQFLPFRGIE